MASLKIISLAILFVAGLSYARTPSYILNQLTSIGRKAHDSGIRSCNSLENLVNNHRQQRGLKPITCHDKPRYLAKIHVYDLRQADSRCRGDFHQWKSSRYTDGRPCIAPDCQLIKQLLGYQFAAAQIGTNGGYAEISSSGFQSDYSVWNGWKKSPGHNDIMLAADGKYPVFGCFNEPSREFAHCIFFMLDKKLPGGSFYYRDCS